MFSLASLKEIAFIVTGMIVTATENPQSPTTDTNNCSLKGDYDSHMTMNKYNFLLQMFLHNSLLEDGEQYRSMAVCMDKHNFTHSNYCSQSCYILSSRIVTTQKKLLLSFPRLCSEQMDSNGSFCASLEYYRPHINIVRYDSKI